jgi:MoxR-like ATPase
MENVNIEALNQQIYIDSSFVDKIKSETSKTIVGQQRMLERLLLGMLTGGHVLLEGMPGLAKTLAIKTLSSVVNGKFSRIQFTPDLLPADIVGTMIYNQKENKFEPHKGPIFANFVLADEINRAPAKVQSALLEAMQEKQVTIGNHSFKLDDPFLVLATQNPIDQEGTYPLPEAQVDRFMLKVKIDYPELEDERQIIRNQLLLGDDRKIQPLISLEDVLRARNSVRSIYMDDKIEQYLLNIVFATRKPGQFGLKELVPFINYGGSPRASISIAQAAKAFAFINRRGYVIPEDIRNVAPDVLRHRIGLTYEAEAENMIQEDIIHKIIDVVEVP